MTKKLQITAPETNSKYPLGHRCQVIDESTGEVWFEAHGVSIQQALERVAILANGVELAGIAVTLRPSYKWPIKMVEKFG